MKITLFHHEVIAPGLIRITGAGNECMYLVIGSKKACLIDSGIGAGNIREYVKTLTILPVIVILTHAHIDHSAGSYYFETVYLTPTDAQLLNTALREDTSNRSETIIRDYIAANNPELAPKLDMNDIVTLTPREFEPLNDGDVFDLGTITLQVISCPGHTRGSVMILIIELHTIIFGDSCNPYVWLHLPESTSVPEYKESLLRIKCFEEEYNRVLLSHAPNEVSKQILDVMIQLCDEVMNGQSDDIPFLCDGCSNAYVAKEESKEDYNIRADGIIGNLVYKKEP